jgi:ubiquinone biosynthesis protein COQ9
MTEAGEWASEAEQQLLDAALKLAPMHGWTQKTATLAGRACGMSVGETELLLPHGPADLAALLSRRHDARAMAILADLDPNALKIRARIRSGVEARLDAAAQDEPALRRWMGYLALPPNLGLAGRLAWESADLIWRWAGDTATDENHYSKRVLLAGILSGAMAVRMADGRKAALAFTDRRIEDVMRFEKWKATNGVRPGDWLAAAAHALGRMRYGAPPS